jgi:hypothetical protein
MYLADDGIATAGYLSLRRWASRCCSKARRASARQKPPRRSPACSGASSSGCNASRASTPSAALYEWNYPRQMLAIRQAREGETLDIYRDVS